MSYSKLLNKSEGSIGISDSKIERSLLEDRITEDNVRRTFSLIDKIKEKNLTLVTSNYYYTPSSQEDYQAAREIHLVLGKTFDFGWFEDYGRVAVFMIPIASKPIDVASGLGKNSELIRQRGFYMTRDEEHPWNLIIRRAGEEVETVYNRAKHLLFIPLFHKGRPYEGRVALLKTLIELGEG